MVSDHAPNSVDRHKNISARAKQGLSRLLTWHNLVTIAVSVVAGASAAYLWAESIVERRISERFTPYELLLSARSLKDNDQPDDSLATSRELMAHLEANQVEDFPIAAAVDVILEAAQYTEQPSRHSDLIDRIERRYISHPIGVTGDNLEQKIAKMSTYPWHYETIGWYYLKVGQINRAMAYFNTAKEGFEAASVPASSAGPLWGMSHASLMSGDLKSAVKYYKMAMDRNPATYGSTTFMQQFAVDMNGDYLEYLRSDPDANAILPAFFKETKRR